VLGPVGEKETTQENIQDYLELDKDPGFKDRGNIAAVLFFIYFNQHHIQYYIFFLSLDRYFTLLIRITA
jgi:hypothetical protein